MTSFADTVVTVGNVTATWREHSQRTGVSIEHLRVRTSRGWTPERALDGCKVHRENDAYCDGEWASLHTWAQRVGISQRRLIERIRCGMTAEQAIKEPSGKPTGRNLAAESLDHARLVEQIAECEGVTRQAIQQRIAAAQGRYQRSLLAAKCIEWRGENGEELTDNEIAELVACVQGDDELRSMVFASDVDVAPICRAMLRMSRGGLPEMASREMMAA